MTNTRARRALIIFMAASAFGAGAAPSASAQTASATPTTVDVRVETEPWTTLHQRVRPDSGPVNMVAGADYTQPGGYYGGSHTCDGRNNGNPNQYAQARPTPITALVAAARAEGLSWYAPFNYGEDDFSRIYRIGYDSNDGASGPFFAIHVNGVEVTGRGCQVQLADGDEVLFSRDGAGKSVLAVTGPNHAHVGDDVTFTVTDEATGAPIEGATVGSAVTDTTGKATFEFGVAGAREIRAEKPGEAVRSAPLSVCVDSRLDPRCVDEDGEPVSPPAAPVKTEVPSQPAPQAPQPEVALEPCLTNGHDGRCGTLDWTPPQTQVTDHVDPIYRVGAAPLVFTGRVGVPYGDRFEREKVKLVKARLTRTYKGKCWYYSPRTQTLRRTRTCGASRTWFFAIGTEPEWRLELPGSLPRGRYVLDVNAVDLAENRDWPAPNMEHVRANGARRGQNRIVFHVR